MASGPASTSGAQQQHPGLSWPANPEVVRVLVGLLSSTVDPFANHSDVYNQIQRLRDHLKGDFELYLAYLMSQWNNPQVRVEVCQAAGLLLKQSIRAKYIQGIADEAKHVVKAALLQMFLQADASGSALVDSGGQTILYKNKVVQNTLGTVISTIVGFEGLGKWPDLFSKVLHQLRQEVSGFSDEREKELHGTTPPTNENY